jgi:3-hydroxy-9,10-secoandrosta-1,3,5(10)-triene-9,17-dione monooxygenase
MPPNPNWFPSDGVDADVVDRAVALRPLLESHATHCEAERRIVDENLDALAAADLFDVIVPKRHGGLGSSIATQLAVSAELAKGCGSTAWVQTIFNVTTWSAALLPAGGQADIFDSGEPVRMCGSVMPTGTATPVDGGYLITGEWGFASGSLHATWATGGVLVLDDRGAAGLPAVAYMPMRELDVRDTWYVAGMRGTGSNTVVADRVFVPAHRMAGAAELFDPAPRGAEPSDRWPIGSVLALVLVGPVLGMAESALEAVAANAPRRSISYTTYERQIDSTVVLRDLAEAALDIDTVRMHVFRAAADIDAVGAGGEMDALAKARLRGACGYANDVARRAVDRLVNIAGASSFAEVSPVQRIWRDLNVASRHAFLGTQPTLELYGRAMYDLDSNFLII